MGKKRRTNRLNSSMEKHFLPDEIITDIISRLPAKSVLKCRRVCKTWRSLTYHPSFARMHLLRHSLQLEDVVDNQNYQNRSYTTTTTSPSSKVSFVSLIRSKDESEFELYYGEYDGDRPCYKTTLTRINHLLLGGTYELVGSCNGLICISVHHNGVQDPVCICNPITREYTELPKFCKIDLNGYIASGFGYHPKTNEYKVVRIYYNFIEIPMVGRVQVYTLGSGTGWRKKAGVIKYDLRDSIGVFLNGALHWIEYKENKILSFDLEDEEFRLFSIPPLPFDGFEQLQVLGGSLFVFHQEDDECVEAWSLRKTNKSGGNDDMIKERDYYLSWSFAWSWNLEFNLEWKGISSMAFNYQCKPFALTKSGEILLSYNNQCLSRYNMKTKVIKLFVDHAQVPKSFEAISHINSFVSLKALGEDAKTMGSAETACSKILEPENCSNYSRRLGRRKT